MSVPTINFKPDVRVAFSSPRTLRAMADLAEQWAAAFPGVPFVVTSWQDGLHCRTSEGRPCPDGRAQSLHYDGLAFDVRTKAVPPMQRGQLQAVMRQFVQTFPGWQLMLESPGLPQEHLHAEWDSENPGEE